MNKNYILTRLLASTEHLSISRTLIKKIGLLEAVIFAELCGEFDYWFSRNGLDKEGYFFSTMENLEDKLNIKRRVQEKIINELCKIGLITKKIKGLPAKRYIKINNTELENYLGDIVQSSLYKTDKLECTKCTGKENIDKENINKENIKEEIYKEEKGAGGKKFIKPSIEDIAEYCRENDINVDAEQFFYFYESKDWLIGKNKMTCWKSAVRTWQRSNTKYSKKKHNDFSGLF